MKEKRKVREQGEKDAREKKIVRWSRGKQRRVIGLVGTLMERDEAEKSRRRGREGERVGIPPLTSQTLTHPDPRETSASRNCLLPSC